jgi:hypothetical protein
VPYGAKSSSRSSQRRPGREVSSASFAVAGGRVFSCRRGSSRSTAGGGSAASRGRERFSGLRPVSPSAAETCCAMAGDIRPSMEAIKTNRRIGRDMIHSQSRLAIAWWYTTVTIAWLWRFSPFPYVSKRFQERLPER